MDKEPIILTGIAVSAGVVEGPAYWVQNGSKLRTRDKVIDDGNKAFPKGAILLADMTSPDVLPIMRRAAGMATVKGGRTCHAAIVSREFGVPCVTGLGHELNIVTTGTIIRIDGLAGTVEVVQ